MLNSIRNRLPIDNRHAIRDPIQIDPATNSLDNTASAGWANTLVKTRIPELFLTKAGLPGHVVQLQNELNRCNVRRLEGFNAQSVNGLVEQVKFVREAVKKSMEAARQSGFVMPNNLVLEFPLIQDRLKI